MIIPSVLISILSFLSSLSSIPSLAIDAGPVAGSPELLVRPLFCACLVAAGAGLLWLLLRRKPDLTTHGSARLADRRDIADLFLRHGQPPPSGGLLVALGDKRDPIVLPRSLTVRHTLVVGGSGSGKSRSVFLPNALALAQMEASGVFLDPKSEIWNFTSGHQRQAWRFAPEEPDRSTFGFNWIPLCRDAARADRIARAIVGAAREGRPAGGEDAVWVELETAYLSTLFLSATTLPSPTPDAAYRLLVEGSQKDLIARFRSSELSACRQQAFILEDMSDRLRGSIVPVLAARLAFLRDPAVQRFTSAEREPPPLGRLRTEPTALYWCLSEQAVARLRPLTAAFFTILIDVLSTSSAHDNPSGQLPVTCYLDESPTLLGSIPDYLTTLALARGRDIAFVLGLQSLAQLEYCFGKAGSQVVLSNCAVKVGLPGMDIDSAGYFARTVGEGTVAVPGYGRSGKRFALLFSGRSMQVSPQARPVLTADEVRRLPQDQLLVIIGNRRPALAQRIPFHEPPCPASAGSLPSFSRAPDERENDTGSDGETVSISSVLSTSSPSIPVAEPPPLLVERFVFPDPPPFPTEILDDDVDPHDPVGKASVEPGSEISEIDGVDGVDGNDTRIGQRNAMLEIQNRRLPWTVGEPL